MKDLARFMGIISLAIILGIGVVSCNNDTDNEEEEVQPVDFELTSTAFNDGDSLDVQYCHFGVSGGENISLPFAWVGAPEDTKSFALIIHDIDGRNWIHWAVLDIPKGTTSIAEGASLTNKMPSGCVELDNEFSTVGIGSGKGYGGPEPLVADGTHTYVATLYALNVESLGVTSGFRSYSALNSLLSGKTIGEVEMRGVFSR